MSVLPHRELIEAVLHARGTDVRAFAQLVQATQAMAYAVAWRIVRDEAEARDAVQDAYLTAFRRLAELSDPSAFAGWLRRIVVSSASNRRRRARPAWLLIDSEAVPPILDDDEQQWSDAQRRQLARALLTLSEEERRLCELHYHGHWSAERIARHDGAEPATVRKRLQRIRDKLRKEIEMDEQRTLGNRSVPQDLPERISELLARPRLVDLPENPIGAVSQLLRGCFTEFASVELPEELDLARAEAELGGDAVYIERDKLQDIEGTRILRYDLTLPLLLSVRWTGDTQRLTTAGKVYRREIESTTHLEAFHQFELFELGQRSALDAWAFAGRIMAAVDRVLPRAEMRVTPTDYPMCARAWSLDVLREGNWVELLAWGEYADWVLRGLGADPTFHAALGCGIGLERLALHRYGIDDVRKLGGASLS